MENWLVVNRWPLQIGIAALLALCFFSANTTSAKSRQEIRFYKVNKDLQADRIRFTKKKGRTPGCHNFLKKVRVHRVVQIGYQSCTLYAKKACEANAEISVTRDKDPEPITVLAEGYSWFPKPDLESKKAQRGVKIKSWFCE